MKKVVIDCLGSDAGQDEIVLGASSCLDMPVDFVLLGEEERIKKVLIDNGADLSRFEIIDCHDTVTNKDNPKELVAGREGASIVKGLLRTKEEDAIAFISAGSTGAVILGSIFRLGLLPGIKFPGLGCSLYNVNKEKVCLLDCGANIDINPAVLYKFAKMGQAFASTYYGRPNPRLGLLNVGKEEGKGNAFSKEAYALLKDSPYNFVGNLEGNDILLDKADVILTDGFAGNVVLKAIESTAAICYKIVQNCGKNSEIAQKTAEEIKGMFDYTDLGSSIVFGSKKIVLKPHGSASRMTIRSCVEMAVDMDERGWISHMAEALAE